MTDFAADLADLAAEYGNQLRECKNNDARLTARQRVYHELEKRHDWGIIMDNMTQIVPVLDRAKAEAESA